MTPEVVVAGHICLDLIPQGLRLKMEEGKLFEVGPMQYCTGGAVSNTGLALHKLGVRVRLIGKVGDDLLGRQTLDIVKGHGKNLANGMIEAKGEATSYSVVLNLKRDRSFLHFPGSNHTFTAADVDFSKFKGAKIFHFGYPPLMRKMYEDGGSEMIALFKKAKAKGMVTSLDLSLPELGSEADKADWNEILLRTLPYVDIFLPSAEEFMMMVDRSRYAVIYAETTQHGWMNGFKLSDRDSLLEKGIHYGAGLVGLKMGGRGIAVAGSTRDRLQSLAGLIDVDAWAERTYRSNAYQAEIAGFTGAGDTSIAGFLMGLLRGFDPERTVEAACAVGASCIEASDALSGVKSWPETEQRMKAGWKKYRN